MHTRPRFIDWLIRLSGWPVILTGGIWLVLAPFLAIVFYPGIWSWVFGIWSACSWLLLLVMFTDYRLKMRRIENDPRFRR